MRAGVPTRGIFVRARAYLALISQSPHARSPVYAAGHADRSQHLPIGMSPRARKILSAYARPRIAPDSVFAPANPLSLTLSYQLLQDKSACVCRLLSNTQIFFCPC